MRIMLSFLLLLIGQVVLADQRDTQTWASGVIESVDLEANTLRIRDHLYTLDDRLIVMNRNNTAVDRGALSRGLYIHYVESDAKKIYRIEILSALPEKTLQQ